MFLRDQDLIRPLTADAKLGSREISNHGEDDEENGRGRERKAA